MSTHPEVLWAQRSSDTDESWNVVYLTVNLPGIQEETLRFDLQPTRVTFSASAGRGTDRRDYAFDLELYADIVPERSTKTLSARGLSLVLQKREMKLEYWPRLTSEKTKSPFIKTDFSKWVDQDEQGNPAGDDDLTDVPGSL
ncbi:p23/wos2 family protein [Streptomyces sp. NPDC051561]|uniref:p23/wos2 family protein n=1 Tax=Streptomyces sp. NPDC051561 TaxID=3365658 RepID=UPI00379A4419